MLGTRSAIGPKAYFFPAFGSVCNGAEDSSANDQFKGHKIQNVSLSQALPGGFTSPRKVSLNQKPSEQYRKSYVLSFSQGFRCMI